MNHTDEYALEHTAADARERSWRTLLQGLALDVAVAVILTLAVAVSTLEWTRAYWAVLGLSVAKTIVQSLVSGLMRRVIPPQIL